MRHTAGDGDLATELVAVMLAPGAHSPAGQKLAAAVSLIPVRMGRGLPAPIALGLPRGHLPARLPFRPDRSSPPAGHSAMKPSAKRSPKVAAADHRQRRRAHRARAALLDCQRLTAVQAPSDRSRFQRTQAYSQNRCSRSPRTRSTSVTTPSARACNATRAAIRTSARGRQRTTRPGREAATRARVPPQAQRQVSRRAIRHERGSTYGAPHSCSSQSCIGKRTQLFAPPEGRSCLSCAKRASAGQGAHFSFHEQAALWNACVTRLETTASGHERPRRSQRRGLGACHDSVDQAGVTGHTASGRAGAVAASDRQRVRQRSARDRSHHAPESASVQIRNNGWYCSSGEFIRDGATGLRTGREMRACRGWRVAFSAVRRESR